MLRNHRAFLFKDEIKLFCLSGKALMAYIRQTAIKQTKYPSLAACARERGVYQ